MTIVSDANHKGIRFRTGEHLCPGNAFSATIHSMSTFFRKLETTVTGGAILIATASLLSRILGLVRDRLLFSTFGAGDVLDSYYVAFRLPDLIFNILVLGALSSAFIPVFLELWQQEEGTENRERSWQLANGVLNLIVLVLVVLGVLGFIFAPQIVPLFAPGFHGETLTQTVHLTRIMLIAILFFGVSNVVSSILNSLRRFFAFAIAPIFYNLGILFGIIVFYPLMGVAGLAWGVVLGAALHLAIQLPTALRMGYRYRWTLRWRHTAVQKVFRLMLPRTIGLGAVQLEQLVSTMIASTLAVGSVAVFYAANNLQSFPINIFGVSLAISSFPIFSQAFAQKDTKRFVNEFSRVFRRILFFIVPLSVLMLLLRAHIVRLVLGAGKFDWEATILTAQALGFFALSLFAQSLIPMLARSFYALQDTSTPVKISFVAVGLNIVLGFLFSSVFGVIGLALSFSIASTIHMLTLLVVLRLRIGELDDDAILGATIRIIVASGFMAFVVWIMLQFLSLGINSRTFVGILVQGGVAGTIGLFVYVLITMIFRFDEVSLIRQWVLRARAQLFNGVKEKGRRKKEEVM